MKIETQDQTHENTAQIILDLERKIILKHNLDFLGLKF